MNIFILNKSPKKCAGLLWKSSPLRANKQILELGQIMSNALQNSFKIKDENFYKQTHLNHPICIWAKKPENFTWCYEFFIELNNIFKKNNPEQRDHKTFKDLEPVFNKYRWHWHSQKPVKNWENTSLFPEEEIIKAYKKTIYEKIKKDLEKKLISKEQFMKQINELNTNS